MKTFLKCSLIATAFAAGAAQAQGSHLSAAGQPVRSASGDCWRTGDWMPHAAVLECDPQHVALVTEQESPRAEPQRFSYATEVLFEFDGAELRAEGRKVLDDLAQRLVAAELQSIAATAHADRLGDEAYNERLALRRADAIRAYLAAKGVPEKLMRVDARGERDPVTGERCTQMGTEHRSNAKLVACLQPDRRVEIEAQGTR